MALKYIGIKLPEKKLIELRKYADKYNNGNVSKTIRDFIEKGLAIKSYEEDISFIRTMINEELSSIIKPFMDRLITLTAKGTIMSASDHFLLAEVLNAFVEPKYRKKLEESLIASKKQGILYTQGRDGAVDKINKKK